MSRSLNELTSGDTWPVPGWVPCEVVDVERVNPASGHAYLAVTWEHDGGRFRDRLYITDRTVGRLAAFVSRLCDAGDREWPDSDAEAAEELAGVIVSQAVGIRADVEIVDRPDRDGKLRRQVSFAGYRAAAAPAASRPLPTDDPPPAEPEAGGSEAAEDDLPF